MGSGGSGGKQRVNLIKTTGSTRSTCSTLSALGTYIISYSHAHTASNQSARTTPVDPAPSRNQSLRSKSFTHHFAAKEVALPLKQPNAVRVPQPEEMETDRINWLIFVSIEYELRRKRPHESAHQDD